MERKSECFRAVRPQPLNRKFRFANEIRFLWYLLIQIRFIHNVKDTIQEFHPYVTFSYVQAEEANISATLYHSTLCTIFYITVMPPNRSSRSIKCTR